MTESQKKAQTTRERNNEARALMYEERGAMFKAARNALQRILENEESTPAETLEAVRLLAKIGEMYH